MTVRLLYNNIFQPLSPHCPSLDLGVQHLQEEFVHGDVALRVQPAEAAYGAVGRLSQQRQRHEEPPGAMRLGRPLAALVLLQGLVERVLETLHGVCALHVLCVWKETIGKVIYDIRLSVKHSVVFT